MKSRGRKQTGVQCGRALQGGFISVHGLRGYGPSHWGSTTAGTQAETAGHIVPSLWETEKDDAATQLSVPYLAWDFSPWDGASHMHDGFPSLEMPSGTHPEVCFLCHPKSPL